MNDECVMRENNPALATVATTLLPYAVDLAVKNPGAALRAADYAAMILIWPYGLARGAYAASKWAGKKGKQLFLRKNADIAKEVVNQEEPDLPPKTKRATRNILGWMLEVYKLVVKGARESDLVKWLKENQVADKLAHAIVDAVIAVAAHEVQSGLEGAGRSLKTRVSSPKANPGSRDYYVWVVEEDLLPIENPYGPYNEYSAKTYARISAQKGEHHRLVSYGKNPQAQRFRVVRIYEAGTGEKLFPEE